AVAITTGRSDSEKRSRRRFSTSMPVSPGIITSSSTSENSCFSIIARALAPSSATDTWKPRLPSRRESMSRLSSLSSTTSRLTLPGSSGSDGYRSGGGLAGATRGEAAVDQLERPACGRLDLLQIGHRTLLSGVLDLVLEQLRVA